MIFSFLVCSGKHRKIKQTFQSITCIFSCNPDKLFTSSRRRALRATWSPAGNKNSPSNGRSTKLPLFSLAPKQCVFSRRATSMGAGTTLFLTTTLLVLCFILKDSLLFCFKEIQLIPGYLKTWQNSILNSLSSIMREKCCFCIYGRLTFIANRELNQQRLNGNPILWTTRLLTGVISWYIFT